MKEEKHVVLVTDAMSFIGPSVVETLAAKGVRVVAADPAFGDGDANLIADLQSRHRNVVAIHQTTPAETVARAREIADGIDILCTGGVLPATKTPAAQLTEDITRPFFEKLAIEPLAYVAHTVEDMKARGAGRIVFLTSAGFIGGIPNYGAYAASRAALAGVVRSLAMELGSSGISVNAIAANFIATEAYFPKALIEQPTVRDKILSRVPLRRFGDPMEAAAAVEFFALGNSGFVTGQVMSISGGWS